MLEHLEVAESDRHSTQSLDCKRKAQCDVHIILEVRPDSNNSTDQLHLVVRLHRKRFEKEKRVPHARGQ